MLNEDWSLSECNVLIVWGFFELPTECNKVLALYVQGEYNCHCSLMPCRCLKGGR